MIPSSYPDTIIHYDSRVYSGQFSDDGNFFFSCGQDFKVRMYDTSNPYEWKYYKTVQYYGGQWTITDASLSPDNKYLAYSSIRSLVALAPTDPNDDSDPYVLDFANLNRPGGGRGRGAGGAGDFSGRGDFGVCAHHQSTCRKGATELTLCRSGRSGSRATVERSWPVLATTASTCMTSRRGSRS